MRKTCRVHPAKSVSKLLHSAEFCSNNLVLKIPLLAFLNFLLWMKDLAFFDLKTGFYVKYPSLGWSPNRWNRRSRRNRSVFSVSVD